jgi:hypothetical protein
MSFALSDLDGIIAHWRSEDIPSGGADPLNWDDVVSGWRLSASGTARPTYSATAIGGKPGLVFDGVNDWLKSTTAKSIGGQLFSACVCTKDGSPVYSGPHALFSATTSPTVGVLHGQYGFLAGNTVDFYTQGINRRWLPAPSYGTSNLLVAGKGKQRCGVSVSGAAYEIGTVGSGAHVEPTQTVYAHMGNFYDYWNGKISELVYWVEPYDANHVVYVEGYLSHKYGITLPTWHPFYAAAPTSPPSTGGSLLTGFKNKGIRVS